MQVFAAGWDGGSVGLSANASLSGPRMTAPKARLSLVVSVIRRATASSNTSSAVKRFIVKQTSSTKPYMRSFHA
jgi:hypothetical protein